MYTLSESKQQFYVTISEIFKSFLFLIFIIGLKNNLVYLNIIF
jgi:hypothetical protein